MRVLVVLSCLAAPVAQAAGGMPGRYIIVFNSGVDVDASVAELGGRFGLAVTHRYRHALRGMAAVVPPGQLARLATDPKVAYIERDPLVRAAAQLLPTGIDRVNAERNPAANIDGVDVLADRVDVDIAILDTGIDFNHPDLNVHAYVYCKTQGPFNTNCKADDAGAFDGDGHGTHVAGTAAAIDNASGVVGVAPGARLWAIKVLEDNGTGSGAQILAGVDYVTARASEIEVVNMSLTGDGVFQSLDDAISASVAAGVTYVLAAGNDSVDVSGVFPAGHPDAITVSALEDYDGQPGGTGGEGDDTFAWFSNFGAGVDIMAPGVSIRSTLPGGGTGNLSGTSMAAPHVAGAAALYLAQYPGSTPAVVKAALLAEADPAPCANGPGGTCADDPDGLQEPLLMYTSPASGDLNDDGVVDLRDLLLGQRALGGQVTLTADQLVRGDVAPLVNGVPVSDGVFSTGDLLVITRIVLGELAL